MTTTTLKNADVHDDDDEHELLVIGAVQCPLRPPHQHPLDATEKVICLMKQAQQDHRNRSANSKNRIDLFVLPELAPIGYSHDTFERYRPTTSKNIGSCSNSTNCRENNQKLHDDIHSRLVKAAMDLRTYICYGTIGTTKSTVATSSSLSSPNDEDDNNDQEDNDHNSNGDDDDCSRRYSCTIRQVVIDPNDGTTVATYDKMSLCNYGDCQESTTFVPGVSLTSFSITRTSFRIGMLVCADIRNPMLARQLVGTHNVDVLLQPSAFSRDCSFRTWKSFCETRAVENSVYVIATNYAGQDFGASSCTPPWVDEFHEPIVLDCQPTVLVCHVERRTLTHVRTTMPFYKQLQKEYHCQQQQQEEA